MNIIRLQDCTEDNAPITGGKAIGLGRLIQADIRVPPGFVVTTPAYRSAIAPLAARIEAALEQSGTPAGDHAASRAIHALFAEARLPEAIAQDIAAAYRALGGGTGDLPVAVRSSATAEDLDAASFAGQQDTYLWIIGEDAVRDHVIRCWASLFTARAITYRARIGIAFADLAMGVVVQQMVPAQCAGVMMTLEPVNGDRSQIYVESAYGLGEIVVRGEVDPDRFWIARQDFSIARRVIGAKDQSYRFDPLAGDVRLTAEPTENREAPSMNDAEAVALARLGARIEAYFGHAVDVEWAIGDDPVSGQREIYALQARAETIWSNRQPVETIEAVRDRHDAWDMLHTRSAAHLNWTTTNAGEAAPGVLTPLGASIWVDSGERTQRQSAYRVGLMTEAETAIPADPGERYLAVFHGRYAMQLQAWATLGDRIPGTTGEAAIQSIFGRIPPGLEFHPTRRFHLSYALKASRIFVTLPSRLRRLTRDYDAWWTQSVREVGRLDEQEATTLFAQASERMTAAQIWTAVTVMAAIQPLFDRLGRLVARAGGDMASLSCISGNPEIGMVTDLWNVSRSRLTMEAFIARHGFHGPGEGEVSSRVWRDDDSPPRRMAQQYAKCDDSLDPARMEAERLFQRDALKAMLLRSVPIWRRPFVRLLFNAASTRLALRGVGKRSYLQGIDVMRIAARRIGAYKAARGQIEQAEDIFYLTMDELVLPLPADVRTLIANRKARRALYQQYDIPEAWTGMPEPTPVSLVLEEGSDAGLKGVGVSAGIVEGRARVVLNPDFADVQAGEILIAPTTDPSWSSIMFMSAGIVVDIGGALSHAAVVAREMKIPCIVNTRQGTKRIQTGDLVRIDGSSGTILIVERAQDVPRRHAGTGKLTGEQSR